MILLLMLIIMASFAEVVSLGAIVPFLGVLTDPERVFNLPAVRPVITTLGLNEPKQILPPVCLAFVLAVVISNTVRLLLVWAQTRVGHAIGADLSIQIYQRTLFQPYSVHVARNSTKIISSISSNAQQVVTYILLPILTLVSSVFISLSTAIAIILIDPFVAVISSAGFIAIYGIILAITKKRLVSNGDLIARESIRVLKALQEGFGGIRDILLDGTQSVYCGIYREADFKLRQAMALNHIIGLAPRYLVEGLGMCLTAGLAFYLATRSQGILAVLPVLGAVALAAQRMLPTLQLSYTNLVLMRGAQNLLKDTLDLLDQPMPAYARLPAPGPIPFQRSIQLQNLFFRYGPEARWVLDDIELDIPKGSRVGFIGATGSGKSTLLDVIMALVAPEKGVLICDGVPITAENQRSWQRHLAHVPQVIFLADTTIAENIAFGVPVSDIDMDLVRECASKACIAETIESMAQKYATTVGERGVRLSGGQRQRIGIARALYKRADVIVLDEATSALDSQTEQEVMQEIEGLGSQLTILIVAHRVSTLRNCTTVVEIANGKIKRKGSYKEMVEATFH